MLHHHESADTVVLALESDVQRGLSANQVETRLNQYGENKLQEKKKKTNLQRFADQFKDVMILILIAAAIISFVIACVEGEPKEFFEPVLILLIVILNAVMGVMQESKAEKALDALKNMSAPHARVIRDGVEEVIDASRLVPGDIIRLEAGDFVPADARLIRSVSLKSEESALTGESVPSEKDADVIVAEDAPIGDRTNMVFSGCSITYGTATAVVTGTGMNTEMGKIANLLDNEEEGQTPLQEKLAQLGKFLLKGRLGFVFAVEQVGDLAHFGVHTGRGNDGKCGTVGDGAAGEDHVGTVTDGSVFRYDHIRILFGGNGFAGQSGFLALEADAADEPRIGRDKVARLQPDNIAGNQLRGFDDFFLTVADDAGMGCGQTFERIQRLFGLAFLHHAHDGVEDHDQQDQQRLKELLRVALHTGNDKGDRSGGQQNQDHYILELIQKTLPVSFLLLFLQLVFSVLIQALLCLICTQTKLHVRVKR